VAGKATRSHMAVEAALICHEHLECAALKTIHLIRLGSIHSQASVISPPTN